MRPSAIKALSLATLLALTPLSGCTPSAYRASADLQVEKILRDRKERTLGYEPPTQVNKNTAGTEAKLPRKSYARIPVTPVPPPQPSALERTVVDVPWGAPGPNRRWEQELPSPGEGTDLGVEAASRQSAQQLKLGPPAPGQVAARFDLFASLQFGVEHSRQYQDQMESLYLAALDVTTQRHLFEPRPFVNTSLTYNGGQRDIATRSALTALTQAGITQQLPYGGQIQASALVQFVNTLNDQTSDGESAQLALSGSIPLLRGAGLVNLEPLISTERKLVYAVRRFEDYRRSFAVDISSRYFRLLSQQQAVNNRRRSYATFDALTNQTRELYASNRVNFLEVQRAVQSLLRAEASLISAQANYDSAVDDFKIALGMPVEQNLEIVPVELDVLVPRIEAKDAISTALRYRLDLQTARDQIDDATRAVKVAQNGLLPDLNLIASSSVGNRLNSPAKELDSRTLEYSGGVQLNLPVDRLIERNTYRASLIALDQSRRSMVNTTESIAADVRDALRQISAADLNLTIQRRGIELAKRRLEYSNELLIAGDPKVSSRDVVESESSLTDAQDAYEEAKSSLQILVLRFLQTTGVLRVDPQAGTLGHMLDRSVLERDVPPARVESTNNVKSVAAVNNPVDQ